MTRLLLLAALLLSPIGCCSSPEAPRQPATPAVNPQPSYAPPYQPFTPASGVNSPVFAPGAKAPTTKSMTVPINVPPVDLPVSMRHENWGRIGSCNYAASCDLLTWMGQRDEAAAWREHSGSATSEQLYDLAVSRKLPVVLCNDGNPEFLQWCSDTRRGAAIHWAAPNNRAQARKGQVTPGNHAITFCGYWEDKAFLIDNNNPVVFLVMPKDRFLAIWKLSGGRAITFLFDPPPPRPWL